MDANTLSFGLFADPCNHSKSPQMYKRVFEQRNINGCYLAYKVNEHNLEAAVESIRALDLKGVNISMPNKSNVIKYLDEIDKGASLMGAVNCIVNKNGHLKGYNTDGLGFVKNLEANNIFIKDKNMVLLGFGGVGRAIAVQCSLMGIKKITIFNIVDETFSESQENIEQIKEETGVDISLHDFLDYEHMRDVIADSTLVVNATSVGMDESRSPLPLGIRLNKSHYAIDVIYSPAVTNFLETASYDGATILNGGGMLKYQGYENIKLWFEEESK